MATLVLQHSDVVLQHVYLLHLEVNQAHQPLPLNVIEEFTIIGRSLCRGGRRYRITQTVQDLGVGSTDYILKIARFIRTIVN